MSMLRDDNMARRTSFFFVFVSMAGLLALCGCRTRRMSEEEATAAFKNYVFNPVPASVANIRADQPKDFGGYRYTFRFNINRDDLALLTASCPFVRVWNIEYKSGSLRWQWSREGLLGTGPITGIPCYDHTREPRWFEPGQWADPEAYAFLKVGDWVNVETFGKRSSGPTNIKILLYNEKEREAYFVVTYYED